MDKLPRDIQRYIDARIAATDWDALAHQIGDLCAGCPWRTKSHDIDAPEPCLQCPLWGLRVDLAQLRLLRRLDRGRRSGGT